MQNTQKSESNFFDNAHLHTTPKLGGVIAQKRYQKSASRQHLHCKPRYAQGLLRYDNACFNDYADN